MCPTASSVRSSRARATPRVLSAWALALAAIPVQPAQFAIETGSGDLVSALVGRLPHLLEVGEGLGPPPGRAEQVPQTLADPELVGLTAFTLAERPECLLIVSNGVLVGVDAPGPVPGRHQVLSPLQAVLAQAEVTSERLEVLQPGRLRAAETFEDLARPAVELRA